MKQTDLNDLVACHLLGQTTAEEEAALNAWLKADPSHAAHLHALEQRTDFADYYARYHRIEIKSLTPSPSASLTPSPSPSGRGVSPTVGTQQVGDSHHRSGDSHHRWTIGSKKAPLLVAASLAIVLVLAAFVFFRRGTSAPVVVTAVPQPVQQAIATAAASGTNAATITIDGQPVAVTTDSAAQAVGQGSTPLLSALGIGDIPEATVTTVHGKEFWLTLPDGTRVHLDNSSQLTYPVQFTGRTREVRLHGKACFFVAHNDEKRFVVHTSQGTISDLGTTFAVDTRTGGRTIVTLVDGSVSVNTGATGTATEQTLRPGEQATLQAGRIPAISVADLSLLEAWNTGRYSFDGVTLDQLMRVVGEWYGLEPSFAVPTLRRLQFSGQLSRYGDPQATLDAIAIVTGARLTPQGSRLIVSE